MYNTTLYTQSAEHHNIDLSRCVKPAIGVTGLPKCEKQYAFPSTTHTTLHGVFSIRLGNGRHWGFTKFSSMINVLPGGFANWVYTQGNSSSNRR